MGGQSRDRIAKLDLLIIPQPVAEKSSSRIYLSVQKEGY
jgi:hypothetical protein